MLAKTRAIVLKNTNFSDNSVISKMYTKEFGLRTYIFQSIRKGKSAVRPSMIQPLSLVELDVYEKNTSNIQRVKELKNEPMLLNIQDSIAKKSIAMFMIEMINHCITEEQCDTLLFDFLEQYILKLEKEPVGSTFPIVFSLELSHHLGVEPQGHYSFETPFFSIEQGIFNSTNGIDNLDEDLSKELSFLLNKDVSSYQKLDKPRRRLLLDVIIKYYQYHIIKDKKVKSVDILADLLA